MNWLAVAEGGVAGVVGGGVAGVVGGGVLGLVRCWRYRCPGRSVGVVRAVGRPRPQMVRAAMGSGPVAEGHSSSAEAVQEALRASRMAKKAFQWASAVLVLQGVLFLAQLVAVRWFR